MTGPQLRNSILQEAIQGRLVPNVLEPGEKTGAELLVDILAAHQQKENEEKGKKAKKLTLSTIEEEPWELPEGWCWARLGDLVDYSTGLWEGKKPPFVHVGVIRNANFTKQFSLSFDNIAYLDVEERQFLTRKLQYGDIIIEKSGGGENQPVGRPVLFLKNEGDFSYSNFTSMIRIVDKKLVAPSFMQHVLVGFYVSGLTINLQSNTTNLRNLDFKGYLDLAFPLPPLSIQKAIVVKIEELLPFVDEYDTANVELEALNKTLPEKLRKSVLQEALHGTLVTNDTPEGEVSASELLQQILKERQDKENRDKGKKAKKLSLLPIEDEPWELPNNWCWAHISDIFDHSAGKSLNSSRQAIGKVYPYLTTSNVYWEGINFKKVKEMAFTEEEYKKCSAIKNDILVCEGGDVGRSCIWPYDYSIGLQNHVHRLRAIKSTDVNYFNYVFRFYKAAGIITAKGIGIGGFSANALKGLSIPVPPLSIQHRIVEKIEEIFSAIDKLIDSKDS